MGYKIKLTAPDGAVDYADMTQDKPKVGNTYLKYTKDGEAWYAKLGNDSSTNLKVMTASGEALYLQKETKG